jgi:hypothetical protein
MNTYIFYVVGGAFFTSLLGNNKVLRGVGWALTSTLIAMLYIASN